MTSRKLQIFKFVPIEMFSPCFLNSRVISFLVRSDCGPLAFLRSTSPSSGLLFHCRSTSLFRRSMALPLFRIL